MTKFLLTAGALFISYTLIGLFMKNNPLKSETLEVFDSFVKDQLAKYPQDECLKIDLHCHDRNSALPEVSMGRILGVPETWLDPMDLLNILKNNSCDTFTITNHNNAISCRKLIDSGMDILPGAEFSCIVPDFNMGVHVLAYGFNEDQEKKLNSYKSDIYSFQEYAKDSNIPTIWAHPLYHFRGGLLPPMDFFNKMSLIFERFEGINGQRNAWQNMLIKSWVETLDPEKIDGFSKKFGIKPERFCVDPYRKSLSGGSDCHTGVFAGLTYTLLHAPELKLGVKKRSELALDAIRNGRMAPVGAPNESEMLMMSFFYYFIELSRNIKDPGLLKVLLGAGGAREKLFSLVTLNFFSELQRHKVTIKMMTMMYECFNGKKPPSYKRFFVPRAFRPVYDEVVNIAGKRRSSAEDIYSISNSIELLYRHNIDLFSKRLVEKVTKILREFIQEKKDLSQIFDMIEIPGLLRMYVNGGKKVKGMSTLNVSRFLDGLSFPFLISFVVVLTNMISTRVLYKSRELLDKFSTELGVLRHPKRLMWLTDTFNDENGSAEKVRAMAAEFERRKLPIDVIICGQDEGKTGNVITTKQITEFKMNFNGFGVYHVPDILEIHKLFKDREYDGVICSSEGLMGLYGLYLRFTYSVPALFVSFNNWLEYSKKHLSISSNNAQRLDRILSGFYSGFDRVYVFNKSQYEWLAQKPSVNSSSRLVFSEALNIDDIFRDLAGI